MSKILQFPRAKSESPLTDEELKDLARFEASFFDKYGYFNDSLNDDDGYEIPRCNNCGYFQHDLHVRFHCRLWESFQWFMDPGCKDWEHWEFHQ